MGVRSIYVLLLGCYCICLLKAATVKPNLYKSISCVWVKETARSTAAEQTELEASVY